MSRRSEVLPGPARYAPGRLACWVLGLVLLLAQVAPAIAATAATAAPLPLRDYLVDRWTSREGLPHNSLRDLAQTPDGYLWFATWEGLVRYDGLEFTVYGRGSGDPALPDNGVGALYVDPSGALWTSDSRGNLGRRAADGQWRFWTSEGRWPKVLVHAMTMDAEGRLWLLFEGHGLGCLAQDGSFEYFPPPPGVPLQASFPRMAFDGDGRLWIGGLDGLMVREPSGAIVRAPAGFGMDEGLAWPYRAPDGALWLVAGDGIHLLQDGRRRRMHRVSGHGMLTALLQDRQGNLWVGSESRGLLRLGPRGAESPPADQARPPGRIVSLLEDTEGSIWAGANGGLFRYRETLFTRVTRRDGLAADYVRALLEDSGGSLWMGSTGGLDRMDAAGRIAQVPLQPGVQPSVLSLAEAADGRLWVGTYAGRVFELRDGQVVRRYGADGDALPGHVRALAPDGRGGVWAATLHGPVRLVDGRLEWPRVPGLPDGLVTALQVIDGALWIGSVEGASVLRDGTVRTLDLEHSGGARTVFGFRQVGDAVWISTDRGLYRVRGEEVRRVGLEHGLPVDTVFQLVPDRLGNAWISSNRGVLRVAMAALDQVADGTLERVQPERHDESDGMSSAQGNGSSAPSAILRHDGSVWVATAGGVSAVDPQRWAGFAHRQPPRPVIDAVLLDGERHPWRDGERLEGGSRLSVSYVGLSFLASDRIRYRTRLDGLDDRWIEHGRQRSVDFIGLPPGTYVLRVAAAHPGGDWSREATWRFSIEPLWWQRTWVRLLGGAAALVLLAGLSRLRIRRLRRANLRLARQVERRTEALTAQTEQLLAADAEKNALLQQLREQSEAFERQAREDALTGLGNRRCFDEFLQREFARARRGGSALSLLLLDIDHFKSINDAHTHAAGDAVLREMGQLLAGNTRACDLAARIGGEEFALALVDAAGSDAAALYARLRDRLAARRDWGGIAGLQVTVSAGSAVLHPGDATPAHLQRRADEALYLAKSGGRDRLCEGVTGPGRQGEPARR
ncbi:diguanylate cyclase [Lysobacter sp. GX 14042]|uniref:ligand-binding sensor domain-containing diguanylate cyclase n=1 Tax=Lysobacter sp. GX 14042 TaxID=2907155 RepID=UPI001F158A9E|nr:ligand-binding sensor domain-containing diguanylate cyclase [Lysobacter sp. GX 14042]MCE7033191.1 diguanylate cyclase [Lysobacter sp. GX 14042]